MALFGKMFEKKNCAICGKELGMFGKTKLADGYLCKDCDGKLSPFFVGRRSSTIEDIRAQLAYREQNQRDLATFSPTTTIDGGLKKIYLDEDSGRLVLSGSSNWRNENPDLIALDQVTGCETEVRESKTEVKRKDAEGNEVSYNPPRYDIDYDIYVKVFFSHPYFSEVSWKTNRSRIERRGSAEYNDAEAKAQAVRQALSGIHQGVRAAAAPKKAVTCPNCLATTMPDANGCCEYCGGSLQSVLENPQQDTLGQYTTYGPAQGNTAPDGYAQQGYAPQQGNAPHQQGYAPQQQGRSSDYGERDYGEQGYDERDYGEQTQHARVGGFARQQRSAEEAKRNFRQDRLR